MKLCAACQTNYDDDQLTFCPRDGEVLQASPETMVGRRLDDKYEIESFIAQGGMGAVYLARHILLGDRVVIKTLRSEMRTNAEWVKRFQREGKAARAFRHPNSVTVYDLSAGADGLVYMVMEYVEGRTLDSELKRRGRFTPAEALEVLAPVADVLDAAHARGVVHRDLKPENIMLGRGERGETVVKVLDLGIAKLVGGDAYAAGATALTTAGQILGTPYYMSPEQWGELPRDGRAEVDGRTDIYSLGVIFFELVAGRKPLGGSTLAELRRKHVAEPLPALEESAPGVPVEFGRAVARAMAKDRGDRPQTAGELAEELRAALGLAPSRTNGRGRDAETNFAHGPEPSSASEADTANHTPRPDPLDRSRADTLLTSGFEQPAEGRATSAPPGATTGHGARRDTSAAGAGETGADARPGAAERARAKPRPPEIARADVYARADGGSAAGENAHPHETADAQTLPANPRRSLVPLVPLVAVAAVALLLLAGVVGWLAWRRAQQRVEERVAPAANASASAAPSAPKAEALNYWLEVFERAGDEAGHRVAEPSAALATGQFFQLRLNPRRRGYLYIVGPYERGNALVMLLTAQGAGPLKSNLAVADADFVFPPGRIKLQLVGGAGTEEYTVVFSPTPLVEPAFFAGKFEHQLTAAEVKEFEEFRTRHAANAATLVARGEGGERRVAVEVPGGATAGDAPVIFDIRLSHR
jgi:eukaryotic-like serine/threonine-protein kinase